MNEVIEISLKKILQTKTYTAVILGSQEKSFCIYMEPIVGQIAQEFFTNEKPKRPQTFDFLDRTFLGLDLTVRRVIISDLQNTTFFSKILLEQQEDVLTHLIEVDARPSDSLVLALRHNAPVFCDTKVFNRVVPYIDNED